MRITMKMAIFSSLVLLLTTLGVGVASIMTLNKELTASTIEEQSKSLRTAVFGVQMNYPSLKFDVDDKGHVTRIEMNAIPEFKDHTMIDAITKATGDTATIFAWKEDSQDFWRTTTNIIKKNGERAVGTPLGQNGRVYPIVTSGKTYRGEATILGKDYFTDYAPIFNPSGKIIGILYVGIEKAKSDAFFNSIVQSIILTSLLVLAAFIAFTVYISNKGVQPLRSLTSIMLELANGNLDIHITGQDRKDEIGDMAKSMKVFKEKAIEQKAMEERERQEQAAQMRRQQIVHKLTKEFESQIGTMLSDVSQSIGTLDEAANSLTNNAHSTTNQIEGVSEDTNVAAQNVESVSVASAQLSAAIHQVSSDVQHTSALLSESVQQTELANVKINQLSGASERISEVVELISNISDQTNLLALNATIEAARAGEAGKGFAVVASEVKNLASQTSQATEEISNQIINIQAEIDGAVAAIREISSMMSEINNMSASVASAVEEQSASTNEIYRSVEEASSGTQRVAENVKNVTASAQDTGTRAQDVSASADQLKEISNSLKGHVEKFLSDVHNADKAA